MIILDLPTSATRSLLSNSFTCHSPLSIRWILYFH
jgi:hypothetical protein